MSPHRRYLFFVAAVLVSACSGSVVSDSPAALCPEPVDPLPGLQSGEQPWSPALATLETRLEQGGYPILTQEGHALDRHVAVRVFVEGREVVVPESIGINGIEVAGGIMETGFVTEMHTHDDSGLVHVHAVAERPFTLGEFFDVWGVALTSERVGGYCADADRSVRLFLDGGEQTIDPRSQELANQSTIVIAYGTVDQLPNPIPIGTRS